MLLLDVLPHLPLPQLFVATLLCGAIVCALVLFAVRRAGGSAPATSSPFVNR